MQSSRIIPIHSISNSNITIHNYFINKKIVLKENPRSYPAPKRKAPKFKNKVTYPGFKLTDAKIAKHYNKYLKKYDALGRDKLTQKDFYIAFKLTWLLARLFAEYNTLNYKPGKIINISYALHQLENESYILFDISGDKDLSYKAKTHRFVNRMLKDKDNPLVQAFHQLLKENNLSAKLVTRVSDHHRPSLYLGPKYCSEKSLYIEIEKNRQHTDKEIKISIANFNITMVAGKNGLVVPSSIHPQSSCQACQDDSKVKKHYQAKNSRVVRDEKGQEKIECENSEQLGTPGNLPNRKLSKPRVRELTLAEEPVKHPPISQPEIKNTERKEPSHLPCDPISKPDVKEKIKDLSPNTLTDEIGGLAQVVSRFTTQFSLFMNHNAKKPQPPTKPKMMREKTAQEKKTQEKPQEAAANICSVDQALGVVTAVLKKQVALRL